MWLYNIKKHKPKLYQLFMESQIKYYLHIQQVKKLYNEIEIIKRHNKKCKIQNLIDAMQRGILNRENLILNIIWLYDQLGFYYIKGTIEMLKKIMKINEKKLYGYFHLEELDKYQMMIDSPNTI